MKYECTKCGKTVVSDSFQGYWDKGIFFRKKVNCPVCLQWRKLDGEETKIYTEEEEPEAPK